MSGRRNPTLAIQLCLCRKLRISSFYNLQHQMPDRCVLTALAFSMPMAHAVILGLRPVEIAAPA